MTGRLHADVAVTRADGFVLDVELIAPPGATTVVLGPNGAGKSTLLAAVAGLVPIDAGVVGLGAQTWEDASSATRVPPADRRTGVVFQGGLLFDHLTVVENVAFGPRSRGASPSAARRAARAWLARLGVEELAERRPAHLSGGQAQRVALARALAPEPRVLLLDEPFSALDVRGRTSLRRLLTDLLADLDVPCVLVTHDPTEAFLLGDVLHVLEEGRTTQVGTPEQVRLRPATPYVADVAGANLVPGSAADGLVRTAGHLLRIADRGTVGEVLLTIPPRALALHRDVPVGSPRNAWRTTVERVEPLGDRVRVLLGAPEPLTAEVTAAASEALGLAVGQPVHVSLKATEITVTPQR